MIYFRITLIILIFAAPSLLSSCVSKKKYVDMESRRNRALDRITVLSDDLDSIKSHNEGLIKEFGQMKNEMHLSSAKKDSYIDSLNVLIIDNEQTERKKDADVADQLYAFKTEKRQLKQAIGRSEKRITEISGQLKAKSEQIAALRNEAVELKFQLNNQDDATTAVENTLRLKEKQIAEKTEELNRYKSELSTLKKSVAKKDEEIEKLSNQVKLLRKELGF